MSLNRYNVIRQNITILRYMASSSTLQYVFQVGAIWCWTDECMRSREKCFDGKIKHCPDTPSVLITRRPVMFVPLRPTLCDRNSSGLHDCIIMHFTFIQICCSKYRCDGSTRSESEQSVKSKKTNLPSSGILAI